MVNINSYYFHAPGIISRVLDQNIGQTVGQLSSGIETVLVIPNRGQVKVLNEVGSRIWILSDGKRSGNEIIRMIYSEYEVGENIAREDILGFLFEMVERGLLLISEIPVNDQ